jgi:NAD(P)-dependent dehydrogenase (short-subunit alcohol dehydrogenase family)
MKANPQLIARLSELSNYARRGFAARGISVMQSESPIIPIYTRGTTDTLQKAKDLFDAGVYINPVLPPATPPDACLLRTSYMATLTEALMTRRRTSLKRFSPVTRNAHKVILITGGSGGIGRAAAAELARLGHIVHELSRRETSLPGVTHLHADVTDESSVARAVGAVIASAGRLDVLVCNAGTGISGAVEFGELSAARRLFDVNFFGAAGAVRAALPHLRRSGGRIVFVSSVAAALPIPFQAYYSAAKAAVNALALALRSEVRPFGVSVCAVMPGDTGTGFTLAREKSDAGDDIYSGRIAKSVAVMERDEKSGMTPERVARVIVRVALRRSVAPLYTAGGKYKLFVMLSRLLPARICSAIVGALYAGD